MDIFKKLQMEIAAEELRGMMTEYTMAAEAIAAQMKVYHEALMKAGFTDEQAFELIKEHGANVGRLMLGGK